MNWKIIFAIVVFVGAILSAQVVGNHEISVQIKDLGSDSNGNEVRGQTCWYVDAQGNPIGVAYVAIDDSWANSNDCNVILLHEFGHVNHPDWSEAQCDDFANSFGIGHIEDAYHNGR